MASLNVDVESLKKLVQGDVKLSGGKLILGVNGFTVEVGDLKPQAGVVVGSKQMPFKVRLNDVVFEPGNAKIDFQILDR